MKWNLEGLQVRGQYLDQWPVEGRVILSRVTYGGKVVHTVALDTDIVVYGATRNHVILSQDEVELVSDTLQYQLDN